MELLANLVTCAESHISSNFTSRFLGEGRYGQALSREQSGCLRDICTQIRAIPFLMSSDQCGSATLKPASAGDDMISLLHMLIFVLHARPRSTTNDCAWLGSKSSLDSLSRPGPLIADCVDQSLT